MYWYQICTGTTETFQMMPGPSAILILLDVGTACFTVQVCALSELYPTIAMMVTCQGGLCERQPALRGEAASVLINLRLNCQRSSLTVH